jgi:hypothetical protein
MGSGLRHEPTKLERLAELAGMEPDELRALLGEEIDEAEMQRVLAEAIAESEATLVENSGRKDAGTAP